MLRPGYLVAFEGTNGTGKTLQCLRLIRKLRQAGYSVALTSWPDYSIKSGERIRRFQLGKIKAISDPIQCSPDASAALYAINRLDRREWLLRKLDQYRVVIADRFTISNFAFQGAKIQEGRTRRAFWKRLEDLEYVQYGCPRPDLVIVLHMSPKTSQRLMGEKAIHLYEQNAEYQERVRQTYLEIAHRQGWPVIRCDEHDKLKTPLEISWEINSLIGSHLGIRV